MTERNYMTVREAAIELGITTRTVQRYIHRGMFPNAYQLPGGPTMPWLIPAEEVQALKDSKTQK